MDEIFFRADQIVADQETRFRTLFLNLAPDIPVIFLPSLFSFNGKVQEISGLGRPGLLMGVDFIMKRNDDLNVLFSHEFFHAYHESHLRPDSRGKTMATPLWKEGFATFVSGILNPDQSEAVLLIDPSLEQACGDSRLLSKMASLYLEVLSTNVETTDNDWFMLSGPTQPTHRGYCLGLNVLRELSKQYPVTEMVDWNETRFGHEVEIVLKAFARAP